MLKLPKGLKKKKKGKKSKRKGEDELFTEEELEQYKKEHLRQQEAAAAGEGSTKNEEWSKFESLTTGVDSVLRKTQGDLDRIKSTSFFQRVVKEPEPVRRAPEPPSAVIQITEADFVRPTTACAEPELSDAPSDDEEDDEDDLFDTSYVDAVERGEVCLGLVPDSPDLPPDDDIFDTSHVDALISGQDPAKAAKGKKGLDIGVAVEVLTGRIDNVARPTTRRAKRVIPGDLLLDDPEWVSSPSLPAVVPEQVEKSILDIDAEIPITTPIDLSISLHTALLKQSKTKSQEDLTNQTEKSTSERKVEEDEFDEFAQLAVESLEASVNVIKADDKVIKAEPVLQESWSAFEADKIEGVFAEGIIEDQIDVLDPYLDQDDPFDTSFAETVVPAETRQVPRQPVIEEDDDFDPRAGEFQDHLNYRRKSCVRIHLTDPSGLRESITSDDIHERDILNSRDLLGGSTTDLTQLGDSPLDPVEVVDCESDPFDTTIVDKVVAPGRVELKLIEQELINSTPAPVPIYRVESDPDFDPRAEEPKELERRASRPENLAYLVSKSVVFNVDGEVDTTPKPPKPVTPYYTRERSITEDHEEIEPINNNHLLESASSPIDRAVLTPAGASTPPETDPFDTSFAVIAPTRTELKLLAKEFSCEETEPSTEHLLDPTTDEIFQVKALSPATSTTTFEVDPFDTSFAGDLQPGRTELRLLESELLN